MDKLMKVYPLISKDVATLYFTTKEGFDRIIADDSKKKMFLSSLRLINRALFAYKDHILTKQLKKFLEIDVIGMNPSFGEFGELLEWFDLFVSKNDIYVKKITSTSQTLHSEFVEILNLNKKYLKIDQSQFGFASNKTTHAFLDSYVSKIRSIKADLQKNDMWIKTGEFLK